MAAKGSRHIICLWDEYLSRQQAVRKLKKKRHRRDNCKWINNVVGRGQNFGQEIWNRIKSGLDERGIEKIVIGD